MLNEYKRKIKENTFEYMRDAYTEAYANEKIRKEKQQ